LFIFLYGYLKKLCPYFHNIYFVKIVMPSTVDGITILTNLVALLSVLFWSARTFNGS